MRSLEDTVLSILYNAIDAIQVAIQEAERMEVSSIHTTQHNELIDRLGDILMDDDQE